jgi:hypothetical protein
MTNNKEFVFISNSEYTRRISNAYDNGYRQGRSDSITKMTNLVALTYHAKVLNTPLTTTAKTTTKKATTNKCVKAGKK